MAKISLDVWLYGTLASYGGKKRQASFANLRVRLPEGSRMADLLVHLRMDTEERGITFINGSLSAMPRLQPDLEHILHDGDRVALFDLKSMWPFQYRHGAVMTEEMERAVASSSPSTGLSAQSLSAQISRPRGSRPKGSGQAGTKHKALDSGQSIVGRKH